MLENFKKVRTNGVIFVYVLGNVVLTIREEGFLHKHFSPRHEEYLKITEMISFE